MTFAMLFPGQGSQSVGMLKAWAERSGAVRDTLAEADAVLGRPLSTLLAEGPSCQLDRTENTQPAMLVADVALWRAWLEAGGPRPAAVAGHSLGEYAALVAAGGLEFAAALEVVQARAEAMRDAVADGAGAMAAVVGLEAEAVNALCAQVDGIVSGVNYNAPTQIVVAGETAAVDALCAQAKAAGARLARRLPVSVPAHSPLMRPARERLAAVLEQAPLRQPDIPLLHNVDARPAADVDALRAALREQVCAPVLWVDTQQRLASDYGCARALEVGPGNVLAGLGRRSGVELAVEAFPAPERLAEVIPAFTGADT